MTLLLSTARLVGGHNSMVSCVAELCNRRRNINVCPLRMLGKVAFVCLRDDNRGSDGNNIDSAHSACLWGSCLHPSTECHVSRDPSIACTPRLPSTSAWVTSASPASSHVTSDLQSCKMMTGWNWMSVSSEGSSSQVHWNVKETSYAAV